MINFLLMILLIIAVFFNSVGADYKFIIIIIIQYFYSNDITKHVNNIIRTETYVWEI